MQRVSIFSMRISKTSPLLKGNKKFKSTQFQSVVIVYKIPKTTNQKSKNNEVREQ